MLFEHSWLTPHAIPQPPQLLGSLLVSVHAPLQETCPAGQPGPKHMPIEHISPPAHCVAQEPQWAGSLARSTQRLPHLVEPPAHESPHMPWEQTRPALHVVPQPPQLFGSTLVSTQRLP